MSAILNLVGNTKMVPITIFQEKYPHAKIMAKMEHLNPGGSIKDRPISRILIKAQKEGQLYPGRTVLDSTSGNAGIAYALFGKILGFDVELVMPGNASKERVARIMAHGANVIQTDPLEGYDEALREAHRRYRENPDKYYLANQYTNENNWLAHYETTAEEIIQQTANPTHFVGGIGTGGSITGTSRRLKEKYPQIVIVCVRPERFPGVEGLKPLGEPEDIVPEILDESIIDIFVDVTAESTKKYCQLLARSGLFVGQSSGAYMAAVAKILEQEPKAHIVTLLNDLGERYISTGLWS